MKKITAAILLALGSAHVAANTIRGTVVDSMGKPVSEGEVQVEGTLITAPIKKDGTFEITGLRIGEVRLHVASANYVHEHSTFTITDEGISGVEIKVKNSSIEVLDVSAVSFHMSTLEGTLPVTVLAGDELNRHQRSTLGDTLINEVGVHSSAHGGVTSTPIIRGLSGPRVVVAQNGLDASDASRVGPDHMVVGEASTAQQIEVLRGPATLFYGSGAIGGVVNIVDKRIPTYLQQSGEIAISRNSNNGEEAINGNLVTGKDDFVFSASGFHRDADEYRVPGMAELTTEHDEHHDDEHDHEEDTNPGIVENSDYRNSGFSVGASYLFDRGYVGVGIENQSSLYGIPGHSHGGHEDEHSDEEHSDEEHGDEEIVKLDMDQTRYQMAGSFLPTSDIISAFNFAASYTDYEHTEVENGVPGTQFSNQTTEFRLEGLHNEVNGWRGGLSLHYKRSDFEALGEEAFTPASETTMFGLGWVEEKQYGDFLFQLGARVERIEMKVPQLFEADLELYEEGHDEADHDAHDDHHDEHEHSEGASAISQKFTPFSLSAGVVWEFTDGYNVSLAYSRAERVPSVAELFSLGPHLGSGFYEIGAFYSIDEENHVVAGNTDFTLETSNNFDFSLRKYEGNLGIIFNVFYNQIDDYYFDSNTGLMAEFAHEHEDEAHDESPMDEEMHDDDHAHSDEGLPVLLFNATDANLYGAELQVNYRATDKLTLRTQADLVRVRVDTPTGKTEAPRTPPMRWSASAEYASDSWFADVTVRHVFEQDHVAAFEDATDNYTLLEMNFSYYLPVDNNEIEFFVKGRNLTDEEARVHTSYLRNDAPLPGRSLLLGIRASF